jgi:hypothetical protein
MFSSGSDYASKVMSVMKRGTLLCVMFFILALVATAGPNAAKISKALGALVIVAIVVTSPVNTVITDLDSLIKNDWVGTAETGGTGPANASGASADSGTSGSTSGALSKAGAAASSDVKESNTQLQQVTGLSSDQLGILSQAQAVISGILGKL